jgi:phage I-like protein
MPAVLDRPKPKTERLVTLKISNGGINSDELPTRLKLLNWGNNGSIKGPVKVGADTLRDLAANQKETGFDRVALDFVHQTVEGSDTYQKDPVEVAAYGTPEIVPNDGLYLTDLEWTPAGKKYASNYHDLSPTIKLNANGQVVFIHSAALCRQGAVEGLHFFNVPLPLKHHTPTSMADPTTDNTVDYKGLLVSLLQKLGVTVADGASDADVASAVDQYKAPTPPPAAKKDTPAAGGAAEVTPMSVEAIGKIIDQRLQANNETNERSALITLATSQGKVIPLSAAQVAATPVDVLRTLVDKAPATVPLTQLTAAGGAAPGGQLVALSAQEKEVCKILGVPEEAYRKSNPAEVRATAI